MSDLATLGLRFETQGADQAAQKLDQVADKSQKAEKATDSLASAQRRSGSAIAQMIANIERAVTEMRDLQVGMAEGAMAAIQEARALDQVKNAATGMTPAVANAASETRNLGTAARATAVMLQDQNAHILAYRNHMNSLPTVHGRVAGSSKMVQAQMLNLTRQFSDIGVTAAMGMNPLMILIQQGPQIAESMALMKKEGVGLAGALRMVSASAAPLLIALAPLIALATAAAAGFALMHRELAKGYPKDVTDGLSLTAEQLERVEHKTVTMGDTFKSTLDVMGKYLTSGPLGEALDWLKKLFTTTMDAMAKVAFEGTAIIVGTILGALKTIRDNWRNFPAVIGDGIAAAVNLVIDGTQRMINGAVQAINLAKRGAALFNPSMAFLPDIPEADLSRFKLRVSGAAEFVGTAFKSNIEQSINDVRGGMRRIGSEIRAGAIKLAQERAIEEAGKPLKSKAAKDAKDELDEMSKALQAWNRYLKESAEIAREWERAISGLKAIPDIGLQIDANEAQNLADKNMILADDLALMADRARTFGDALSDAFGRSGTALGGLIDSMATFQSRQADSLARLAQARADYAKEMVRIDTMKDPDEKRVAAAQAERNLTHERIQNERELRAIEVERNVASLRAFKSLFKEKSAAYKVLTGLELAYQAIQLAGHIKAMALDAIHTAKSIASAFARGAADAAAGAAKMFSQLGVFAFPVVAAMVGLLVALGLRIAGGGGSSPAIVTAEERQKSQGAGTVLGEAEAKSESIARSLELVEAHTNKDLEYSNSMLRALRSIDQNIGALTAALARQLGVAGGIFDSSGLGLGSNTKLSALFGGGLVGGIPIIGGLMKSLFGTKTTRTLVDQGLNFDAQSLEDILNSGLLGEAYQDVAVKKKKKFLGITTSNKTKLETTTSPLEDDILTEMARVLDSLRTGIIAAAGVLGIEGADATLDAFVVEIGKISLKDMTGAEIQETLNAVFGKLGDQMAEAVFGQIGEFQKAGEGAMETLVRLARDYQVIDITLASIGKTFGQVGLASIAARERLVEFFGSLDDFVEQTAFFAENFLTDVERMVPIQAAVEKELTRLGLSGITTKDAFKNLVLGLDTSTAAGAEMYAALLALAPAFLKVVEFSTEGSKDLEDAGKRVKDAYSKLANDLQNTIDKFKGFADSLRKFRESLTTGPAAMLSPEAQYKATKSAFEQTAAKARLGDETALADLQSVSQAYLDASKAYYASSGPYFQDLEAVKVAVEAAEMTASRTASNAEQQLAALTSQVTLLGLIEENTRSLAEELAAYNAIKGAAGTSGGNGLPAFQGGSGTAAATFSASGYLAKNPDIQAAWDQGTFGSRDYATAEEWATHHYQTMGYTENRAFAMGGLHAGGLRLVGERGPELESTGPSRIWSFDQTRDMLAGNDNGDVCAAIERLGERLERIERATVGVGQAQVEATRSGFSNLDRTVRDRGKTQRLAGK